MSRPEAASCSGSIKLRAWIQGGAVLGHQHHTLSVSLRSSQAPELSVFRPNKADFISLNLIMVQNQELALYWIANVWCCFPPLPCTKQKGNKDVSGGLAFFAGCYLHLAEGVFPLVKEGCKSRSTWPVGWCSLPLCRVSYGASHNTPRALVPRDP